MKCANCNKEFKPNMYQLGRLKIKAHKNLFCSWTCNTRFNSRKRYHEGKAIKQSKEDINKYWRDIYYPKYKDKAIIKASHRPYILKLKKDRKKCEFCGSNKNLESHHLKYIRKFNAEDIKILCRSCHRNLHRNIYKNQIPTSL